MTGINIDVHQAIRQLVRRPLFTVTAAMTVTMAIAANMVVFGVTDGLVLRPFTYEDPGRLISIGSTFVAHDRPEDFIEQHPLPEIRGFPRIPELARTAAFDLGNRVVARGPAADRVFTALVVDDPAPVLATSR